jgi:aspartate/methionine/tyrosine aminotransferase
MRFAPIRHMAWAKRHQLEAPTRLDLSTSAVDYASIEDLGGIPAELPLKGNNGYGHPDLLKAIAGRYGLGEERVLPISGSSLANFLVGAALVQPGDRVVLERPVYEPLLRIVEAAGGIPAWVDRRMEDGWAVDPEALRHACGGKAALAILTNLHNPTGAGMDAGTVRACAAAAASAGANLLVDEVYLDSAFAMSPPPRPAATLAGNAVSTASWTKSYGLGGLRSGWVAGPADLIRRLKEIRDAVDVANPYPIDILSLQAWARRDALLERSGRRFRENWAVMAAWLARNPAWRCTSPAGGFVCCPRVPDGIEVPRFLETLMARHGCAVTPGEFFGLPRHIRIGFGGPTATLEEGLAAIDEVASEG